MMCCNRINPSPQESKYLNYDEELKTQDERIDTSLVSCFFMTRNTIEYMLMMQEDPQRVPSANSKSPSEEESKNTLGGQEEKDGPPNLQSLEFPFLNR
ncbi:hypothetical protein SADUNF_Sadunf16G0009400 [Salix dunnii]|uniref:Uncharacterized protein n=1 Tax=Salix dunnii TaxID=1413687 RepID=A0A835J7B8_9ROSI|nr:hypothetical protein SADUNF_Sadunf16G0009400 [Salix dunnii]